MFLPPRMYKGSHSFPVLHMGGRRIPLSPRRHSLTSPATPGGRWPRGGRGVPQHELLSRLELLEEGKTVEELTEAIDQLRALPELTRELALDHTHTLRLLSEEYRGRHPASKR